MSTAPPPTTLPPDIVSQILSYLSLPSAATLPTSPLVFLRAHFAAMPATILQHFAEPVTTARERSSIPEIKAKRLVWASGGNARTGMGMAPRRVGASTSEGEVADGSNTEPPLSLADKPAELEWNAGRKRWPALWERLGGPVDPFEIDRLSSVYPPRHRGSSSVSSDADDSSFAMNSFLPSDAIAHHPSHIPSESAAGGSARSGMNTTMDRRRFGAFLRSLEEEREAVDDVAARRLEREFDRREEASKEEFDSDSDDEEEAGVRAENRMNAEQQINHSSNAQDIDVEEVIETFERRLLELFVDGLDTISYAPIDFADPALLTPNRLTVQDHEDAYFDDEEEGRAPPLTGEPVFRTEGQLGEEEYDY